MNERYLGSTHKFHVDVFETTSLLLITSDLARPTEQSRPTLFCTHYFEAL